MRKKVLIITYYWPPAGGPGVQRWLKFVKYLPEFGIEPIVYTPENAAYPILDYSFLEEEPKNITLLRQPIKEPYKYAGYLTKDYKSMSKGLIPNKDKQSLWERILLFIRGNFFIPDARIGWVKPSVAFLSRYLDENPVDIIITSGPPHSLHLIGKQLKEKLNIRWLADFRDPWSAIDYHKDLKLTHASMQKHKKLEQGVLDQADTILVTSPTTKKMYQKITQTPIEVITNGYDNEGNTADIVPDEKFTLSHIGSLLSNRNPEVLWRVLGDLIVENDAFGRSFQLNLLGATSKDVIKSLQKFNLSKHINNIGYLSHKEVITYQRKSQVLLLIEADLENKSGVIPGKLFEYMVSNRPILAIGPKHWDVLPIIRDTNTGSTFEYSQYDEIKSQVLTYFEKYIAGTLHTNPVGLQKYSRKALTESLTKLL